MIAFAKLPLSLAVAALTLLGLCRDETLSGYTQGTTTFALVEVDGRPFTARATIDLSEPGRVTGKAPCNSYFAPQTAPYPWFEIGPIGASKVACPDLDQEQAFFAALRAMTLAEISGPVLILSNEAGATLVFRATPK